MDATWAAGWRFDGAPCTDLLGTAPVTQRTGFASPEPLAEIAGMSLTGLRNDYHDRLFRQYLPYWEHGAIDRRHGGIICELNVDGSVSNSVKNIWYQGRGIWVYSFLHNQFGGDPKWRDTANMIHDFVLRHMYAGHGRWHENVSQNGVPIDGALPLVLSGLYVAEGLLEHYRAFGNRGDLALARETVVTAARQYESPDYNNTMSTYTVATVPARGLRTLAHSLVFLRVLSQWPEEDVDDEIESARDEHLDAIMNRFWHPGYGILTEMLLHDYARFPRYEGCMYSGHALAAMWIVLHEAVRRKNRDLFVLAANRFRRLIEISWDDVFGGCGSEDFMVFELPEHHHGQRLDIKTMWAQCEAMIGCMTVFEYTGHAWAKEWYSRIREFALRTMPCEVAGVWRQAVDRLGNDHVRAEYGISDKRRDNYHQARYLMLNLQSLERMLKNQAVPIPFPE
ncbi:MAG: AGE family epimerase/isomerase [Pirellulales bacterium]|nr:AGE family epimerase/isomerase [Pirellulales bacterium]